MAVTHTEIYRPFEGELRRRKIPWWPITAAGIRLDWKKKLPVLLLYVPVGIAAIIHCFMVYSAFLMSDNMGTLTPEKMLLASIASQLLDVRWIISDFNFTVGHFSVLVMAWFGAGLICEDRRVNAHLLYFARPIRRSDYLLGKLAAIIFWGACTSLLSGLVICVVAAFTSPDWVFVTEEYGTIFLTIAYSCTWILTSSLICLAMSSLLPRKTLALVGIIAFYLMSALMAEALMEITDSEYWGVLSPSSSFNIVRLWIFANADARPEWSEVWPYFAAIASYCSLSWAVLVMRVRRLEIVA